MCLKSCDYQNEKPGHFAGKQTEAQKYQKKKKNLSKISQYLGSPRSPRTSLAIFWVYKGLSVTPNMSMWLSVCSLRGGVEARASFWESQGMQPRQSYFKVSPACLHAPHTSPLLSQAAVAQVLGQVWRGLFREQREVLAPGHFTPNELLQR